MPLAPKDSKSCDFILKELLHLHGGSEEGTLDAIFSFLSRETCFYTDKSMTAAREIILKKFENYGADAFKAEKKKKKYLEEANRNKKKELKTRAVKKGERLENEKKKTGQAASSGRSKTKIPKLLDEQVKMMGQGLIQKKPNKNQSSKNGDEHFHSQNSHTGSENEMMWLTSTIHGFPPTQQHAAVAVENKIFSFGGISSMHRTDSRLGPLDVFVLNVFESELKWKILPVKNDKIPNQRKNHSAVAYNEFIFIFGGQDTETMTSLNSTSRLNTKTLEWDEVKATGNIPSARYQHSAVLVGHDMIVFGGLGDKVKNDVHFLDLDSFHWSTMEAKGIPPTRLYDHSYTVYDDNFMFIFGGRERDRYKYSTELFCLDVKSKEWTQRTTKGRFPKARQGHSAFVHNGRIIIFGGVYYNSYLNSLLSYNPETFEWKQVKPIGKLPPSRDHFGCVVMGDRVFLFGGYNRAYRDDADDTFVLKMTDKAPGKMVAEQELINATDTETSRKFRWSTRIQGHRQRMQHAAVAVEHTIFSIGGKVSLDPLASQGRGSGSIHVHVLNVDEPELTWKLLPVEGKTIPNQRKDHSAVAFNEFFFIFGGKDTITDEDLNSTYRLNTKTLEWDEVNATGNIPVARYQHSAVVVRQTMIVFGGLGRSVTNDLHCLDLKSLHWSRIGTQGIPPACVYGHSATVYMDHFMYIFGGRELTNYNYSAELFCFDVNSKKWTQPKNRGGSQNPRQGHSAFADNGRIFIFGGSDSISFLNSLVSYNPETFEWIEVTAIEEPPSPRHRFGCVAIDHRVYIFGGCSKTYCEDTIILEMGCTEAEKTVAGQESVNASGTQITDTNATSQDKAEPMKRKRSSSRKKNKVARTCVDLNSRSRSPPLQNESSSEDENNTDKRRALYGASIKVNPFLTKIKLESDYIPPTVEVKHEPDE